MTWRHDQEKRREETTQREGSGSRERGLVAAQGRRERETPAENQSGWDRWCRRRGPINQPRRETRGETRREGRVFRRRDQGDVAGIAVTDPPYLSLSARGIKFARCQYRRRQRLVPLESVNIPLYALLQLSIKRLHITSWTPSRRRF